MATDFRTVPGVYTGASFTTRNIFANFDPSQIQYLPTLAQINGSLSRDTGSVPTDLLRAGLIMGKITATGLYRNSIIGVTTAAYVDNDLTITVPAAVATEVARLITVAAGNVSLKLIGPATDAAAGSIVSTAVTASAASGTTITVADLNVAKVSGSLITPADGAETPVTVLPNSAGIDVLDTAGTNINQMMGLFLRGADLIATQIVNLTEPCAAVQAWLKQQLNGGGTSSKGLFTFDNDR